MADESLINNTEKTPETVSYSPVPENVTQRVAAPGTHFITKSDGKLYQVRDNRLRFFYPHEWIKFFDSLKEGRQKDTFDIAMGTGGRINEVINIKAEDHDPERNTIILKVTKVKAKLGEKKPKPRTIPISSQLSKRIKRMTKDLKPGDKIPMLTKSAATQALKNHCKSCGIKDWQQFSLHNIRKTHGCYLKALGIEMGEICSRLSHDSDTYLKSYASPDVFNFKDMEQMRLILGDLYSRRMKW